MKLTILATIATSAAAFSIGKEAAKVRIADNTEVTINRACLLK